MPALDSVWTYGLDHDRVLYFELPISGRSLGPGGCLTFDITAVVCAWFSINIYITRFKYFIKTDHQASRREFCSAYTPIVHLHGRCHGAP